MASSHATPPRDDSVVMNPGEDPANILRVETFRAIEKFLLVFLPCVVLLGLTSNTTSGLVFWCQGLRDRMNLCLFCLTLADFAYLISILAVVIVSTLISQIDSRLAAEYSVKAPAYGIGFLFGFAALSRLISMVIAVERCVCVVFPLRAASLIRTRTMGIILAAIFVFVQLTYSTLLAGRQVTSIRDNSTGEVGWQYSTSSFTNSFLWQIIYNIIPRVVLPIGTFLATVTATVITVVRLRAAMAWRQQTSSHTSDAQGQQMALTKMLVILSCVDITCSVPAVVQAFLEICLSEFMSGGPFYNLLRTTGSLSTVFICINSSANFFVYFQRSSRFRHALNVLGCYCQWRGEIKWSNSSGDARVRHTGMPTAHSTNTMLI